MGIEEVERIKEFFSKNKIKVEYLEHEEVITSADAAKQRGFELKQGIKAILFTDTKGNWVVVDVPADEKINNKKVAEVMGWSKSKIRIATPEEVLEQTGCEIGAVPPFGHKKEIKILLDKKVYNNQINSFNIGLRTKSVKIETLNVKKVFSILKVLEGEFSV